MLEFRRTLPFLSQKAYNVSPTLKELYTNSVGQLDLGRLLSYLDINAGGVAWTQAGTKVVTAAMGSVAFQRPLTLDMDYDLNFHINKTWNSSLEVGVEILGNSGQKRIELIDFYFTFVGIDDQGKSTPINKSDPKTKKEIERAQEAEIRKQEFINSIKKPLTLEQVTSAELNQIKQLKGNHQTQGDSFGVHVSDTYKEYLDLMVLRNKNTHEKVFGGYVLEQTFNHAWTHAYQFTGEGLPLIAAINRINFMSPIEIGELVTYKIRTIYTHETSLVQEVIVNAENPDTKEKRLVNTCYFTFVNASRKDRIPSKISKKIIPYSTEEVLLWIEADRRRLRNLG